jgi:hypothetical protein
MSFDTDKHDLNDVLQFIEQLLTVLVSKLQGPEAIQFQRVWAGEIRPKLQQVKAEVQGIQSEVDAKWKGLADAGWTAESLRLKGDSLASAANRGALGTVFKYVNSALGSLAKVFPMLDPVKEFKEFLEPSFSKESEPVPYIQTLFPGGSYRS